MIVVTAEFNVKDDCVSEFVRLAAECTKNTRKESGNLSYKVFAERNDGSKFVFIEEWANDTAIEKHGESAHFKSFINSIEPLLENEPKIKQIMTVAAIR